MDITTEFESLMNDIISKPMPPLSGGCKLEAEIANKFIERVNKDKSLLGTKLNVIKRMLWNISLFRIYYSHRYARAQITTLKINENMIQQQKNLVEDIKENMDKYKESFLLLDDESKQTYIDLIRMKYTGDFSYGLKHYHSDFQYFDKAIKLANTFNIVDCGGYIGDTMLNYLKHSIIPNKYYVYELEDENFKKLKKNARIMEIKGTKVIAKKKGVWSESRMLYFKADRDSSRIVNYETSDYIQVVSLDDDIDERVDVIKMDIEGSEVEALNGAKRLITNYRPILEICIYHKTDDFWRIPLLIKDICPYYQKWIIRHYSDNYNETVLYAFC